MFQRGTKVTGLVRRLKNTTPITNYAIAKYVRFYSKRHCCSKVLWRKKVHVYVLYPGLRFTIYPFTIHCVKLLGVDWGEKRIGLALADGTLAQPFGLVSSFEELEKVIRQEGIGQVVLGLPEGKHRTRVMNFGERIKGLGVPVVFHSEVLTTHEALQKAIEAGKSRKARQAQLDSLAAALLLQEYLDSA